MNLKILCCQTLFFVLYRWRTLPFKITDGHRKICPRKSLTKRHSMKFDNLIYCLYLNILITKNTVHDSQSALKREWPSLRIVDTDTGDTVRPK